MCHNWEDAHHIKEHIQLALNIEEQTEVALHQVYKLQRVVAQQLVAQTLPPHILQTYNVSYFHNYVSQMERAAFYQAFVKQDHQFSAVKAVPLVIREPLV